MHQVSYGNIQLTLGVEGYFVLMSMKGLGPCIDLSRCLLPWQRSRQAAARGSIDTPVHFVEWKLQRNGRFPEQRDPQHRPQNILTLIIGTGTQAKGSPFLEPPAIAAVIP